LCQELFRNNEFLLGDQSLNFSFSAFRGPPQPDTHNFSGRPPQRRRWSNGSKMVSKLLDVLPDLGGWLLSSFSSHPKAPSFAPKR